MIKIYYNIQTGRRVIRILEIFIHTICKNFDRIRSGVVTSPPPPSEIFTCLEKIYQIEIVSIYCF